jgi:putative alpha-1,2-mannosidase
VIVAQHQDALIVSSYQKGIRDFDTERAWRAIKHDLTTPGTTVVNGGFAGDRRLQTYLVHGYVPDEEGPTSNTFEYAYDDWCAAQFAGALGHDDDNRAFLARSANWRHNLDPETSYARRRHADGRWAESPDIFHFGTEGGWNGPGFVEGNAWIYTLFVPQDPGGLIAAIGRDEFNRRLEEGFARGYVDLTNEPNMQAPFLFNYSGRPLTRAWLYHAEVVAGGTLEFEMGAQPNPDWGTRPEDAPPLLRESGREKTARSSWRDSPRPPSVPPR